MTSGVRAVCKCSVFKCSCKEGRANITSRVCECSCNLPGVADVLLPRDALLPSVVVALSTLSLSTQGNLSTAVQRKKMSDARYNFILFHACEFDHVPSISLLANA